MVRKVSYALKEEFDQAINDIRRKYESEKLEIVNFEKEKVRSAFLSVLKWISSNSATHFYQFYLFRQTKLLQKWKENMSRSLKKAEKI